MRPEAHLWELLRPRMAGLDPVRIENMVTVGVPDVNYTRGWIELKAIRGWPKRETTIVKLDHFMPQQRGWLVRRRQAGGRAFVLLSVGDEWILFDGAVAAIYLGRVTKAELFGHCLQHWTCPPDVVEFQKWI